MKVISIIQPWATLIAIGEKRFETRSWATKHRGDLAIHASKRVAKSVCREEPFKSILAKHGYTAENLSTGVIIATSKLIDCHKVITEGILGEDLENAQYVRLNEYKFGDYTEGRYAWELSDVQQIEPISARGQLNLWEYPIVNK